MAVTEEQTEARPGGIAAEQLRSYVERIERMEQEKADIQGAIRDVYAEAKGTGFDPKIMRAIVRLRKMDRNDREEQDALMDLYRQAVGL